MKIGYWLARGSAGAMIVLAIPACSGTESPEVAAAEVARVGVTTDAKAKALGAGHETAPSGAAVDEFMARLDAEEKEMARTRTKAAGRQERSR